jgi:hypothetical protein
MSSAGHILDMILRIQANRALQTDKKHKSKGKIKVVKSHYFVPDDARILPKESKALQVFNAILVISLILLLVYIIFSNLIV